MIQQAIQARIPIIMCRTSDTLNLLEVLKAIAPNEEILKWSTSFATGAIPTAGRVYYAFPDEQPGVISSALYVKLISTDSVLILVNREDDCLEAFNAGELEVPKSLIEKYLKNIVTEDEVPKLMKCVSGLTIKQLVEVVRIAQVLYGSTSPRAVMAVRSNIIGQMQGLKQVQTGDTFYIAPNSLDMWLTNNKEFFLNSTDQRLIPRGLIFYGEPGVGKTEAAKYLAAKLEVPLYRLDLSSSLGKYVGESESNLSRILASVDQEAPCVMLIDEIEKVFKEKDDAGVTSRLLSQLLWWLQEHHSRVLTIMTTNNVDILPPELYREGRIDEQIKMFGLKVEDCIGFVEKIIADFGDYKGTKITVNVMSILENSGIDTVSQAFVVKTVAQEVKKHLLKTKGLTK